MKYLFIIFMLTSSICFADDTNINYADIPRETASADMFGMVLSAETNALKSGVWIDSTNHVLVVRNGKVSGQATVALLNMSTNIIHFWYFWPSTDLQFQIKLVDDKGNVVPKTVYGKRFGRTPEHNPDNMDVLRSPDPRTYGLINLAIMPQGDILDWSPDDYNPVKSLPKCFAIKRKGNYKFTLIRHIYATEQRTNGLLLKPITFSPVTVDVRVESLKRNGGGH